MKITYIEESDVLLIALLDEKTYESDEVSPGVILDYNENGEIIGFEILDASTRVKDPRLMTFDVAIATK
jgi:uncharacterized protein YuzE